MRGSTGYYTFENTGTYSLNLEVTDPDGITTTKKDTIEINSVLGVEVVAFPRVIKRNGFIKFVAESKNAEVFEWDFADGKSHGGNDSTISHTFEKSGTFDVKVTVYDKDNNKNTYTRTVYVSQSQSPFALIDVSYGSLEKPEYDPNACDGQGAYRVNRIMPLRLNGGESINVNGDTEGLEYSWKI